MACPTIWISFIGTCWERVGLRIVGVFMYCKCHPRSCRSDGFRRAVLKRCKVQHEMSRGGDLKGRVLKTERTACDVCTSWFQPYRHPQVHHLRQGEQYGHSSFLKNVHLGCRWRCRWEPNDACLRHPCRLAVGKGESRIARSVLNLDAMLVSRLRKEFNGSPRSHRASTANVQHHIGRIVSQIDESLPVSSSKVSSTNKIRRSSTCIETFRLNSRPSRSCRSCRIPSKRSCSLTRDYLKAWRRRSRS